MNARSDTEARRRNVTGFLLLALPSLVAAGLLALAVPYYAGASARIASLYTNLATPADDALTPQIDAYNVSQHHNLAAAKRDLSEEAKTEASFDNQLGEITFPPGPDPHVDLLIAADQKRIKLIRVQLQAKTLRRLRSFDARIQAADAAVEVQVGIIRKDLGLPAASTPLY
jgi:hypothetical protein